MLEMSYFIKIKKKDVLPISVTCTVNITLIRIDEYYTFL